MAAGFLLALREGLEAALIVGLLLGALRRTRHAEMARFVWIGVGVAAVISLAVGAVLVLIGARLEGAAEELFEGLMMTLAVIVLTWVVLWMRGQHAAASAESEIRRASTAGQRWAVFMVAFVAVGREGLETGLFVSAAALASDTRLAVVGAALGLISAALLGGGLYLATLRLDVRRFFAVTSILLILFAAGLLAHAVHEFNELGWIPSGPEPVWDTSAFLSTEHAVGQTAAILFGYDPTPALAQVVAYVGYLITMTGVYAARLRRPLAAKEAAPAP